MPQQVCNIFQGSAFHSQTARKCMVAKSCQRKVLDLRFGHPALSKPVPPIFERLPGLHRLEHTGLCLRPGYCTNPQGGNRSII